MVQSAPETRNIIFDTRSILIVIGMGLLIWVLYILHDLVFMVCIAALLAAVLYPAVDWLKTKKLPRRLTILVLYLLVILFFGVTAFLLINMLIEQGHQFLARLPFYLAATVQFAEQLPFFERDGTLFNQILENLNTFITQAIQFVFSKLSYLFAFLKGIVGLISILVFTFYFLTDAPYFESVLLHAFPKNKRADISGRLRRLAKEVGYYLRGQAIVMSFVGILTFVGLSFLGVRYALILGMLAGILDIMPVIGPLAASAFGLLVILGQAPSLVVGAAIVYFVVQQVENYVLVPLILGRTLGLHPFWILVSILVGASLLGIAGVLLAIPATLALRLVFNPESAFWLPTQNNKASSS